MRTNGSGVADGGGKFLNGGYLFILLFNSFSVSINYFSHIYTFSDVWRAFQLTMKKYDFLKIDGQHKRAILLEADRKADSCGLSK